MLGPRKKNSGLVAQSEAEDIIFHSVSFKIHATNRHKQHVKFVRRVKNWFGSHWKNDPGETEKALIGEGYTFLRTTGRPCNCEMCTYKKYKRTPKHKRLD